MNERTRTRLMLGALGLSALVIALAADAGHHRGRVMDLEVENRELRDDHDLILAATIAMWQDALHQTEEDLHALSGLTSAKIGGLEDDLERRTEDLMVCDLQLGGRDWDQAILDVCGPPLGYCGRLLDGCRDDLVAAEAQDQARWDARDEIDRVLMQLDACEHRAHLWDLVWRETDLTHHPRKD